MDKVTFKFNNSDEYSYEITISDEGVVVHGCDCEDKMTNEVVRKVYESLGLYLYELDNNDSTKT